MSSMQLAVDHPSCIETELSDILTVNSCTALVSELIKFILYRKQQLPYTFDRLKYLITNKNSKNNKKTNYPFVSSVEQQFKIAEDGLATLELLFEKTKEELADSKKGFISEVALLFGSTPMTPKQVYRIHLPELFFDHSSINHPERKHLLHLLQSVILSKNLSNMLTKPMNPTNMYVFIKRNKKLKENLNIESKINKWFIPKNKYTIPKTGQHFHIKLRHPHSNVTKCSCQNFKIYSDNDTPLALSEFLENQNDSPAESLGEDKDFDNEWFQACEIFKGFRDVYINGVSVADLWLR